jgi:O-antigen/teichoic acid export membrane protein
VLSFREVLKRYEPVAASLLDQILVSGGNIFTVAVCAHLLGVAEQGKLGYIVAAQMATVVLNMAALFHWASVEAPRRGDMQCYKQELIVLQFIYATSFSVVITCIINVLTAYADWNMTLADLTMVFIFLVIQQLADFDRRSSYTFSFSLPWRATFSSSLVYVPRIMLILVFRPTEVAEVLYILTVTAVIPALLALISLPPVLQIGHALTILRQQLSEAGWMILVGPLMWIWSYIPVFILGAVSGLKAVGIFVTVRSASSIANVAMELIETQISATAGRLHEADRTGLERLLTATRSIGMVFWAMGCLGIAVVGSNLLTICFGKAYEGYVDLLIIFWISNGIAFLFKLDSVLLRTAQNSRVIAFSYLSSIVGMFLVLNPLTRSLASMGAALAVLLGSIICYVHQRTATELASSYFRRASNAR